MMKKAVEVNNVSMRFNLSKESVSELKEYFIKLVKRQLMFEEFYALRNISFTVDKGDAFAIVGANGSGKSTMLKIISGIYKPTTGNVRVNGSIAPLIELGAGFDQDLTARENVFLNGAILGHSKVFMQERYAEIIDFAELDSFQDVPIKNFSSGMAARLGFAIATIVRPEILIVDEILSVGDFSFKQKCEIKMQELMSGGTTLILVSHSFEQIRKTCKNAIWIKNGELMTQGEAGSICDAYLKG